MCGFIRSISLFLLIFPFTSGLYFHIGKTERKCFIEEVPDETAVLVNYRAEIYDPRTGGIIKQSSDFGMHVEVKDPFMKTILSRVYRPEGKIIVTSHVPGEHVICLYSHSTKWIGGTQLRVHLNIQVGEHTINYTNVAQQEKLSYLQLRMVQLLDQVESITKELNYQRYREERFRQTSESINQRVFWWSTAQLVILIAMVIWQMIMRHLKSFFEDKKEDKDFDCHLFERQMSVKGEQIENSKAALLENKIPVQLVQIPAITVERRDESTGEFQGVMQDVIMDYAEEH